MALRSDPRKDGRVAHTSVDLDPVTYRWLKRRRGETDERIKDVVGQALREFMEREDAKAAARDGAGKEEELSPA